jgi:signal transduction histidine kinase
MRIIGAIRSRHFSCVWLVVLWSALVQQTSAGSMPARKTVLVINEVGLAHPASTLVTERLLAALSSDGRYQVQFYVESIDASTTDERSEAHMSARLGEEYRDRNLDVIVAMGPAVIKMITRHDDAFFPKVPVVICGGSAEQAGNPVLGTRYTGSWMKIEPKKTLDAALELLPKTQRVFVVGGASDFDRNVEAITRAGLQPASGSAGITYLTDLDMSVLLEQLRKLPPRSLVLYTSLFQDATGNQFVNASTALPLVAEAANAPVFGMSDTYIGHGVVGGYVISFAEQGRIVADIVSQLFAGEQAKDIPVTTASSYYMFDWRQLHRWKLSEARLPTGSVVVNREPTLWEKAKWVLLIGGFVIVTLTWLLAYLLYSRAQLRRARSEQVKLSGKLITAHEDERSRVAAELHDDFSQRLALLSLGIETTAELVPESSEEAKQQLNELLNSASELGADIHTLSHSLHSSTLDRLGLVSGLNAFCKEFTAQQHVKVIFTHDELGRSVPRDTALSLFRIVQEGLRNVSKHSGASLAQVRLTQQSQHLHLSISDNGGGFEANDMQCRQGLGLFSMEERARLVGASFEVQSEAGKGTRIEVWAPVPASQAAEKGHPAQA